MGKLIELLSVGLPYIIGLLAWVLPFRVGILGERFRSALLWGWGLHILAYVVWGILNPVTAMHDESSFVSAWMAVVVGWLPACALFLVGRLSRWIFRLQITHMGWGRFTLVLALLIAVLWWPGVRVVYFIRMTHFGTMASSQSDFSRLSRALPPPEATLVRVYRGLPHQMSEPDLLWNDLFHADNRAIGGYRFHTQPIEVSAALRADLPRAMQNPGLYRLYSGRKLCGGYHPDYCFEWESQKRPFYALLCLGCDEIRLVASRATVHCDMNQPPVLELLDLVEQLQFGEAR